MMIGKYVQNMFMLINDAFDECREDEKDVFAGDDSNVDDT